MGSILDLAVRMLVIAVVLLPGCASMSGRSSGAYPRITHFEQESQKIEERENRCVREAATPVDQKITNAETTPGTSSYLQANESSVKLQHRLFECRASADRERAELSARERADYQERGQEERDQNSLMMILISSRPQ
jgi:hypothetical protein